MTGERLQKVLSRSGVASRRKAEVMIREGRVTVNGQVAALGQRVDIRKDAIKVDGKRVAVREASRYYLLNKPRGYITSQSDPEGRRTVLELLEPRHRLGVRPVGRLDYNTEGLLILTDDGNLAQSVAHPSGGCVKVYEAKVKGTPSDTQIRRLSRGFVLEGSRTRPARIMRIRSKARPGGKNTWWRIELREGRSRQIREMFFRIGHPVQRLRRTAIGPVTDKSLPIGAYRELSVDELKRLRSSSVKRGRAHGTGGAAHGGGRSR